MGSAPSTRFSSSPATSAEPAGTKMWRPCSKRPFCRGRGTSISPTSHLHPMSVKTNLHRVCVRNGIRDGTPGSIQIPRNRNRLRQVAGSVFRQPRTLAARDGMNHQDFALFARNFLNAFTCRHVEWLRAGLGFIFGNNPVYFVHVGGGRIVFEKCRIAVG